MSKRKTSLRGVRERATVGWREWVALPDLGIPFVKAKVDTGARSSALHAARAERFTERGAPWTELEVRPYQRRSDAITVRVPVIDERTVKDSGGHSERRLVIETTLKLGDEAWPIEMTVTNRDTMLFKMLLGRTAMRGRLLVDPSGSYLLGKGPY